MAVLVLALSACTNKSGLVRLITDITSGTNIDIIDLTSLSVEKYVRSGKLIDLNPYIASDLELRRDDFFENILDAMEINGGLYEVTPRVNILTMVADPELAGAELGWTINKMQECIDAGANRPGGPLPFTNTSLIILDTFLRFYMGDLINWTTDTVDFGSDELLFALELAERYPMEHDYKNLPDDEEIRQGYLASFSSISTPFDPIDARSPFSVVKGFPVSEGSGNAATGSTSIGLMSTSPYKDQAWEFMRCFLLSDGPELGYGQIGFSINKNRFERDLETGSGKFYSAKEMDQYGLVYLGGKESELGNWAKELMLSVSRMARVDGIIQNIVAEEASAYFSGDKTVAEVVKNMESRIKIYVAE